MLCLMATAGVRGDWGGGAREGRGLGTLLVASRKRLWGPEGFLPVERTRGLFRGPLHAQPGCASLPPTLPSRTERTFRSFPSWPPSTTTTACTSPTTS